MNNKEFFSTKVLIYALIAGILLAVVVFMRVVNHWAKPQTLTLTQNPQELYASNAEHIRILPINRAKFLAGQRFDFLVECSGELAQSSTESTDENSEDSRQLQVLVNDIDAQSFFGKAPQITHNNGVVSYRIDNVAFNDAGEYVITASKGDKTSKVAYNVVLESPTVIQSLFDKRAKNVILLIGDGMSLQAKQMARILSKGINEGKYNGLLEMEQMPQMALVSTSGYDSLTTDSANSASAYATGHKSVVNAMGVYEASINSHLGHPKVENIAEILRRTSDKSIGLVTTSNLTDATPAAFITHTRQRYELNDIALDMFDESHRPHSQTRQSRNQRFHHHTHKPCKI